MGVRHNAALYLSRYVFAQERILPSRENIPISFPRSGIKAHATFYRI